MQETIKGFGENTSWVHVMDDASELDEGPSYAYRRVIDLVRAGKENFPKALEVYTQQSPLGDPLEAASELVTETRTHGGIENAVLGDFLSFIVEQSFREAFSQYIAEATQRYRAAFNLLREAPGIR